MITARHSCLMLSVVVLYKEPAINLCSVLQICFISLSLSLGDGQSTAAATAV